jgi:hypothetical protein
MPVTAAIPKAPGADASGLSRKKSERATRNFPGRDVPDALSGGFGAKLDDAESHEKEFSDSASGNYHHEQFCEVHLVSFVCSSNYSYTVIYRQQENAPRDSTWRRKITLSIRGLL